MGTVPLIWQNKVNDTATVADYENMRTKSAKQRGTDA